MQMSGFSFQIYLTVVNNMHVMKSELIWDSNKKKYI